MKIGQVDRRTILTRRQRGLLGVLGVAVGVLVVVAAYNHLSYRQLRALVVGNTIELASRADGRVISIELVANEPYRRGAVLARLANDGLRADIESVEREIEELERSLAFERSGQALERRRYELETTVAEDESKLEAARIGIGSIDRILGGLAERRDRAAERLRRAEELVDLGAMTVAELEGRRQEALTAARQYEEAAGRRQVLVSERDARERILTLQRHRLENLASDRTGRVTDLEIKLADRRGDLDGLRDLWGELTVVADHDGMVTAVYRKPGEYVPAGQPILAVMTADDIWVEAYLPPSQKRGVQPGDRVRILHPTPGAGALDGRIDRILPVLQPFPGVASVVGGGQNYAVLVIKLGDASLARRYLSPAQEVTARVRRRWGPLNGAAAAGDQPQ